jgi:hypothetical protein
MLSSPRIFPALHLLAMIAIASSLAFADSPTTAPAKTGDLTLTFTDRSPQSSPKDLAHRLNLKPTDVANDYDLSSKPYKAYVPTNYDPATPHGIFVYLGYKDSTGTPKDWHPLLEKSHLIFITPVSHTGTQYEPSIPLWQTLGLAFDAVHNLKQQYAINPSRIYLMVMDDNATQLTLVSTDVFTGFVIAMDPGYFRRISAGNRYYPPTFPPPPEQYKRLAQRRPYFLLDTFGADDPTNKIIQLKAAAMKQDGIKLVDTAPASLTTDLHYPDFKVEWFEDKALPFLDKSTSAATTEPASVARTTTKPTTSALPAAAAPSPAAHALSMARLYIKNGQPELARTKLQLIIETFPNDPAAEQARELLKRLP